MAAIDYIGIQTAIFNLLGSITGVNKVFMEAMQRDMLTGHMPLVNVRQIAAHRSLVRIPGGYDVNLEFKIDVLTIDFTSFIEAARLRDNIIGAIEEILLATTNLHVDVSALKLEPIVEFHTAEADENHGIGAHIAAATISLIAEVTHDRS